MPRHAVDVGVLSSCHAAQYASQLRLTALTKEAHQTGNASLLVGNVGVRSSPQSTVLLAMNQEVYLGYHSLPEIHLALAEAHRLRCSQF